MPNADQEHSHVDPVIKLLRDWAEEQGLTNEELAARIGVSRPSVVGWLTYLRDHELDRAPSKVARRFSYLAQPAAVQAKIAAALALPAEQLRSESRGGDRDQSQMGETSATVLNALSTTEPRRWLDEVTDYEQLRYRVAEVAADNDTVEAVSIVAEPRGRRFRHTHQHQIIVYTGGESDRSSSQVKELRDAVSENMTGTNLPGYWEHGAKEPKASIEIDGRRLVPVGSLVCPYVAAPRAPQVGMLVRPAGDRLSNVRTAAVLSAPYGGSVPIASFIAQALGAGHIRIQEVVRLTSGALRERIGRDVHTALADEDQERHAAYVAHQMLAALSGPQIPGAWLLSLEAKPVELYEPLKDALCAIPMLITVQLSEQWEAAAAWRLAAAEINQDERARPPLPGQASGLQRAAAAGIATSDQIEEQFTVRDGLPLADDPDSSELVRAVLDRQAARAREMMQDLRRWHDLIAEIESTRSSPLITIPLRLGTLPPDITPLRFDRGKYEAVAPGEAGEHVIYPDILDGMVDAWVEQAASSLRMLMDIADRNHAGYVDGLKPGPAQAALAAQVS